MLYPVELCVHVYKYIKIPWSSTCFTWNVYKITNIYKTTPVVPTEKWHPPVSSRIWGREDEEGLITTPHPARKEVPTPALIQHVKHGLCITGTSFRESVSLLSRCEKRIATTETTARRKVSRDYSRPAARHRRYWTTHLVSPLLPLYV